MKQTILAILFLTINSVFGQNKEIEYNEIIPEYIIAVWEKNGTENNPEFNVSELSQIKEFFTELRKNPNKITSHQFLTKPTDNTLVAHYINTKLKWNSFN